MDYIDLHIHSTYSDGTYTPAEIIKSAREKNLRAIALTDHDCIDGIPEAIIAAKEVKIELITGMELSAVHGNGVEVHILGLNFDYKNIQIKNALLQLREGRVKRNIQMIDNLYKQGIAISESKLAEYNPNGLLTRMHFALFLRDNGYVKTTDEAFKKYLSIGKSGFVKREGFTTQEAINLINNAGGKSFLAHPLLYKVNETTIHNIIIQLKEYGLNGIEAIYSTNTEADECYLIKIANKQELLICGGSDFHGENKKGIDLGVGRGGLRVPYSILEKILKTN